MELCFRIDCPKLKSITLGENTLRGVENGDCSYDLKSC